MSATGHPNQPLAGRSVLVTRPAEQAGELCRLIAAAGGRPLPLPLIAIEPIAIDALPRRGLARLPGADLIIFISTNAVRHGVPLLRQYCTADKHPAVLCIGAATARCAEAHGLHPLRLPADTEFNSEGLLRLECLQAAAIGGKRVIVLRGRGGRELLAQGLRERGARVDYLEVYRRAPLPVYLAAVAPADCIVITSGEALEHLAAEARAQKRDWPLDTPLAVISRRIAEQAVALGFTGSVHVAPCASDAGLIDAVIAAARQGTPPLQHPSPFPSPSRGEGTS